LGGTAYLTLRDQVVLRARSFKGLSNRQAAILLDIHPGHYSRLRRAAETKLRELRRLINESGGDSECLDEILSRIDKRS
jgi:hypothetical protein